MDEMSMVEQVRWENGERGYYIRDDVDAERALKRLQNLRSEREQIVADYKQRMENINRRFDNDIAVVEDMLADFFGRVPHRKTKTQEYYQLANGKLVKKRQEPEYKFDQPRLVAWMRQNAPEYIKVKEEADWINLKKLIAVSGNQVMFAETGEMIPGITAEPREDKLTISVKEDE